LITAANTIIVTAMSYPNIDSLPQHVAIIMDGNGRWAKQRGLPRLAGHWEGATNAHRIVEILFDRRVKYVTLYVFSTENWNRPKEEVEGIFQILMDRIDEEVEFARRKKIRICHLGELDGLPPGLRNKIKQAVELTKGNKVMTLSLALNYGGRDEIVGAVRRLLRGGISAGNVDEALFRRYLYTAGIPDPDLIIRTGGEMRLSNFLLWQAAYAEFYSTSVLWPDFNCDEVDKAFMAYRERRRRFGSVEPSN
jgi:undecaprenyl diphosphate synthase